MWTGAACATVVAWFVATHWSGRWPAAVAVLIFLVGAFSALALSLAGSRP